MHTRSMRAFRALVPVTAALVLLAQCANRDKSPTAASPPPNVNLTGEARVQELRIQLPGDGGAWQRICSKMATGTGKTFTLVNEVYRLMKSGVGRRILFLVDRRALAAQAVRAFASFEPEPGLKFDKIYEVYSQRFRREGPQLRNC